VDSKKLTDLFLTLARGSSGDPERAQTFLSILQRATLAYRDRLLDVEGVLLTVKDVRKTLEWLLPALATGETPQIGSRIRQGLLEVWLKELKTAQKKGASPGKLETF